MGMERTRARRAFEASHRAIPRRRRGAQHPHPCLPGVASPHRYRTRAWRASGGAEAAAPGEHQLCPSAGASISAVGRRTRLLL